MISWLFSSLPKIIILADSITLNHRITTFLVKHDGKKFVPKTGTYWRGHYGSGLLTVRNVHDISDGRINSHLKKLAESSLPYVISAGNWHMPIGVKNGQLLSAMIKEGLFANCKGCEDSYHEEVRLKIALVKCFYVVPYSYPTVSEVLKAYEYLKQHGGEWMTEAGNHILRASDHSEHFWVPLSKYVYAT